MCSANSINRNRTAASLGATRFADKTVTFLYVVLIALMINVNKVYFLETLGFLHTL